MATQICRDCQTNFETSDPDAERCPVCTASAAGDVPALVRIANGEGAISEQAREVLYNDFEINDEDRAALTNDGIRDWTATSGGRTNLGRALNGRDIAALALSGSDRIAIEDFESGLTDALANLLHFSRRYAIDFDEALESARRHHAAEARYGWDEVPQ